MKYLCICVRYVVCVQMVCYACMHVCYVMYVRVVCYVRMLFLAYMYVFNVRMYFMVSFVGVLSECVTLRVDVCAYVI